MWQTRCERKPRLLLQGLALCVHAHASLSGVCDINSEQLVDTFVIDERDANKPCLERKI